MAVKANPLEDTVHGDRARGLRHGVEGTAARPDGVHRSYFESGARRSEVSYRMGKRHGPSLGWWENGRPETVAAYADDKMTEAKTWDRDGKLVADDQFEADGSRKIRR